MVLCVISIAQSCAFKLLLVQFIAKVTKSRRNFLSPSGKEIRKAFPSWKQSISFQPSCKHLYLVGAEYATIISKTFI